MSQARHGPLWTSCSMFVPFDASLLFIPVFVYPRDDPSPPPVDLQPALVGRQAAACQSGAQSPTGYFFSAGSTGIWGDLIDTQHGFYCEQSQDLRYAVWAHLVHAYRPCYYVLDVQTRHIGYIRDVSAPRLLSTPVDPCLTGSSARSCTARIKASVPVFCSCLELLMLATSSVCCSCKPRNCFFPASWNLRMVWEPWRKK